LLVPSHARATRFDLHNEKPHQHASPRSDSGVLVFLTGEVHGEEIKDDSVIELDGTEWKARVRLDHLQLVRVERSDDKNDKANVKRAAIKNELEKRKEEVSALEVKQAELITQCQQVLTLCHSFVAFLLFHSFDT
jgi:hypothetical protein